MIRREEILAYIKEKFCIEPDYPWARTPNYAILRHRDNGKWFGAIMDITEDKLGLGSDHRIDALNLKCDPLLVGSLRGQEGIYPAYHMNKEHWITISLSSAISKEQVCELIDLSFRLTE